MRLSKLYPIGLCFCMLISSCMKEEADLIIRNATIYTVDENFSVAEAMAINNDTIVAIGPEHEILNKYGSNKIIDAKTQAIYPGFIDAHCHLYGYGLSLNQVNLVGTKSFDEVIDRVKSHAEDQQSGWITGRGWDQNDWNTKEFPNKSILDSLFPNTPVFIKRIDGHAALANQTALDQAEINNETTINGGLFLKENGLLTGIAIDNAVDLINEKIPLPTKMEQVNALLKAQKNCIQVGLTTIDEAGLDKNIIELIDSLQEKRAFRLNVYAMANPNEENIDFYLSKGPILKDKLTVRSFKVYADGALGSRGAKLLKPYDDMHDHHSGLFIHPIEFYSEIAKKLYNNGFQMNTHAIGDSANRFILNLYGQLLKGVNDKRWRIEHAQVLNQNDFHLFQKYTILPSVQPTHATSDMYWASNRIGNRIKNAYAYKKLQQQNGIIALGTDFPVEDIDPLKTFYAAVARKDKNGYPDKGFEIKNALSREEALKGMTIWAAIANFEESKKGSLEPGKKADFVILTADIMKIDEQELLNTKVSSTYIDGKLEYDLNSTPPK